MENDTVFVLLAGGKSQRMGIAKGLLEYKQTFWILEQLNRVSKANISTVYIGLGYNHQFYFDAIPWFVEAEKQFVNFKDLKVKVVLNKNPELGSFATLQTVLKKIPANKTVLINPIDTPILNLTELNIIIKTQNNVILPNYEGKNGHPIKLTPEFWQPLLFLNPIDKNARLDIQIKKAKPSEIGTIEVKDSCVIKNLNTKDDWVNYLNSK